jgi:medium-chain acyl-[acyl-carrier-protein] hydrolase
VFRRWSDALPSESEICAVQLPARENRMLESPSVRIVPLVQTLADVLHPYLTTPFAFFGHSMGALISFELARHLRSQYGRMPVHMFVSAHRAPQLPDPGSPLHHLPDPEFIAELRRLNGTPEEVLQHAELMQMLLPLLRADFAICETYVYTDQQPLDCPISAFGGLQDGEVHPDDLAAWRNQTTKSFTLRFFEGNHFFLHSAQPQLLQILSEHIIRILRLPEDNE